RGQGGTGAGDGEPKSGGGDGRPEKEEPGRRAREGGPKTERPKKDGPRAMAEEGNRRGGPRLRLCAGSRGAQAAGPPVGGGASACLCRASPVRCAAPPAPPASIAADQPDQLALHFHLMVLQQPALVGGVGGLQRDHVAAAAEGLQRGLLIL